MPGVLTRLLHLDASEVDFARRGFNLGPDAVRRRLERTGAAFVTGYNAALENPGEDRLSSDLEHVESASRGFAYEGAAMALSLLDHLLPWPGGRWRRLLRGAGARHVSMVYVGRGWTLARTRARLPRALGGLDPLLGWLAADGCGFHEGYFRWRSTIARQAIPGRVTGYARRAFDQGLGRSLWFVDCGDVDRLAARVAGFPRERRGDLWAGVGLAAAYAGGAGPAELVGLQRAAAAQALALAQGAAFAAKARALAGNPAEHTEAACRVLCGVTAARAARLTDEALLAAAADESDEPRYERWRQLTRARFRHLEVMYP